MVRLPSLSALALLVSSVAANGRFYEFDFDQALLQPALPPRDPLPAATPLSRATATSDVSNSVITTAPEVLRRQQDPKEPLLCNDGICGSTQYCTVFQTKGPAVGVCCGIGLTCTPQLDCVSYNTASDPGSRTAPVIFNEIVTCDRIRPYCIAIDVVYGYGTELLHVTNCFSENIGTTTTTNNWWYSKFVLSVDTSTSTSRTTSRSSTRTTTSDPTSTTTQPPETSTDPPAVEPAKDKGLSTGAIAGIAVGGVAIVCIAACIVAFLFFRRRKRQNAQSEAAPPYYSGPPPAQQQYYAPKPEQQAYASPVSPNMPVSYAPYEPKPYEQGTPNTMVPTEHSGTTDHRASTMSELPGSAPYSPYRQ